MLRTALGTATAPPNAVIIALALFLTAFVMGPALQTSLRRGRQAALVNNEITVEQAFDRSSGPLKVFMQKNVRENDLALFIRSVARTAAGDAADMSLRIWFRPS